MTQKQDKVLKVPQYIKNTSKVLQALNKNIAAAFALKLFETPMKHKIPKREQKMYDVSVKTIIVLPDSKKEIVLYENKFGSKKVLLVHGWSGRGTQLVSIAKAFKELNYTIISFDAPGHGNSIKDTANMKHFIEAIVEINNIYNGFDAIIGHSLGGMSVINALGRGVQTNKAVIIGSGNKTNLIIDDFLSTIGMSRKLAPKLIKLFEHKYNDTIANYDVEKHTSQVKNPVLIIHDKNDKDVPYHASEQIVSKIENCTLLLTEGLGHRKILGDEKVIEKIVQFVNT